MRFFLAVWIRWAPGVMLLGCGDKHVVINNIIQGDAGMEEDAGGQDDGGEDAGDELDGGSAGEGGASGGGDPGGFPDDVPPENCESPSTPAFNLAVDGTVTAVDEADDPAGAFDDNTGTEWRTSGQAELWIAYEFPDDDAHVVTSYSVSSAGDHDYGDPRSWELQGSEDGPDVAEEDLTWTVLDTQTEQEFSLRYQTRLYSFSNDVAFHRYRLLVTEAGSDGSVQISELQLFADGTPVFSVDDSVLGTDEHEFDYSEFWTGRTIDHSTARYNGSSSWSNSTGDSVSFTFVGSRILLYGIADPKHGIGEVLVNGSPAGTADFYGTSTTYNRLVYHGPWLCPGAHVVTVAVTGDKRGESSDTYVSLDRIQVVP